MAARKVCPVCGERYSADVLYCPVDGGPLASRAEDAHADPLLGTTVDGLRLVQLVGIGTMARVYRSHQAGVDRDVAVKVLRAELTRDTAAVARFWREARVAGRLAHPGVVTVLSTGSIPPDAVPFMVMEFLDGMTLRSLIAAHPHGLATPRALHLLLQIADAVGDAHAAGVVHRDLKPENVIVVRRGEDPDFAKILDFGVARAAWVEDAAPTRAGSVLGTADYLSPEVGRGQPATPATDVYALATMAYECFAGSRPFVGPGPVDVLVQKSTREAPSLATSRIPATIARWVDRNLSRATGDRDLDGRAAGRALLDAASSAGFDLLDLGVPATLGTRRSVGTRALTLDAETRARLGGKGS